MKDSMFVEVIIYPDRRRMLQASVTVYGCFQKLLSATLGAITDRDYRRISDL